MSGERDKIQAMLDEGTITASEADELLTAMREREREAEARAGQEPAPWAGLPARGEAWRTPFTVAAVFTGIGGVKLLATRNRGGLIGLLRLVLIWPLTLLAGLAAIYIYVSRERPWLHVRVREAEGDRFAFSVPYPGPALERGLAFAREQAGSEEAREKIDAAIEMLDGFEGATAGEPLVLDIEDEDGSGVQVYLN